MKIKISGPKIKTMNKKIKYLTLVVLIVILAGLAYLFVKNYRSKVAPTNNQNAAVPAPSQQVATGTPRVASTSLPVYTKEIKVEFMTDAEKLAMKIPATLKIQVLERDKFGKVTAYKIIRQDSEIMTKFGN